MDMSDSSENNLNDSGVMEVTGRVLIATIIALVVVLVLVVIFHIYAKWLWHRRQQRIDTYNNHRPLDNHAGVAVLRRGLDAAFLKTLPVLQFDSKDFKDGLECSVCLCELQQGEKTRILPKCNHAFHAECIDMWFHSHSTCPICRNPVSDQPQVSVETLLENNHEAQATNGDFPTNVLFWGDETEVSTLTSQLEEAANNNHQAPVLPFEPASTSSSSAAASSSSEANNKEKDRIKPDLVIDIPRQFGEVEELDARTTPIMRSLRRILSSGRRFNPFSPPGSSEQPQTS